MLECNWEEVPLLLVFWVSFITRTSGPFVFRPVFHSAAFICMLHSDDHHRSTHKWWHQTMQTQNGILGNKRKWTEKKKSQWIVCRQWAIQNSILWCTREAKSIFIELIFSGCWCCWWPIFVCSLNQWSSHFVVYCPIPSSCKYTAGRGRARARKALNMHINVESSRRDAKTRRNGTKSFIPYFVTNFMLIVK